MLNNLKKSIAMEQMREFGTQAILEASSDEGIKDAFLDNVDLQVTGAENDPEIAKLCDEIPGYSDDDQDMDLQSMTESFIPETII